MSEWKKIENIDMHCFACGQENEHGLRMTFESDGSVVRSFVTIPKHLRGWSTLAHGGVIATILDETMSWTAIHMFQKFILTQSMTVEFKKPVYINSQLKAEGWIKERLSSRKAVLKAEIKNQDNEICAVSEGKFALFEPEKFKEMDLVPNDLLDDMEEGMFN